MAVRAGPGSRPRRVAELGSLRELGLRLAIDDFGTGYSSLSYLRRLPVDILRIGRSFVAALGRGPEDAALSHAIVKLGHTLDLHVVAEGIETAEQLSAAENRCNEDKFRVALKWEIVTSLAVTQS